jgi:TadE-like protein
MTMTTRRRGAQRRSDERGAVAVEFALILPVLAAMVFGIIEFGFFFAQSASLAHGAREGARMGVVNSAPAVTCAAVEDEVQRTGQSVGMAPEEIEIAITGGGVPDCDDGGTLPCAGGGYGTLTVTATFDTEIDFLFVETPATVTGTGAYRCEYR